MTVLRSIRRLLRRLAVGRELERAQRRNEAAAARLDRAVREVLRR